MKIWILLMALAITPAIATTSSSNTTSYASGAFTPVAGDRLVVFVYATATVQRPATLSNSAGLTFTQVRADGTTDSMYVWYSNQNAAASSQTVTFDCTGDAATGCVIMVFRVSGFGDVFTIVQSGFNTFAASGTPTVTMTQAFVTNNAGIGCAGNATNPATLTPRTSWIESSAPSFDVGYTLPTTGMEGMYRNSGETASSIAWGGTSASAGKATVIEIKAGQYAVNAVSSSYSVSGSAATPLADRMIAALLGTYILSGTALTTIHGYVLNAATGTYLLAGSDATLIADRMINAGLETYVVSGANATIFADRIISADGSSYAISGVNAQAIVDRLLDAGLGDYVISGMGANLDRGFNLSADAGIYILSGSDATLVVATSGYSLNAAAGNYGISGLDAGLLATYSLGADAGVYVLAGRDAVLNAARILAADPEAYIVTGENANILADRIIQADPESYIVTGDDATLEWLRKYVLEAAPGVYLITGQLARALLEVDMITGLTDQDKIDIASQVHIKNVEGSYSLNQTLKLITAIVSGDIVKTGNDYSIKALGNPAKERIRGLIDSAGNRTIESVDVS